MIRTGCEREQDVLDAIAANRWPDRLSDELSAHVAGCAICRDLASVAHAFAEDCETAFEQAQLPSAGLVWWRAEIRARQQAVRAASRPITLVQVITGTCGIAVALGLLAWTGLGALGMSTRDLWAVLANQPLLLPLFYLAIGALVILGSVAIYLVLSDE
jgi:hypothetical protein